jgi:hypothetical protein
VFPEQNGEPQPLFRLAPPLAAARRRAALAAGRLAPLPRLRSSRIVGSSSSGRRSRHAAGQTGYVPVNRA